MVRALIVNEVETNIVIYVVGIGVNGGAIVDNFELGVFVLYMSGCGISDGACNDY